MSGSRRKCTNLQLKKRSYSSDDRSKLKVYIFLPRLAHVRTVTDHMRPLSNLMGIEANRQGGLRIKIQTEDVALETSWTDCGNPTMGCKIIVAPLHATASLGAGADCFR